MTPVVLASKSASRRVLLEAAGVSFEAVGSGVDEDAAKADCLARGLGPRDVAETLAAAKALAVSTNLPAALVIGADQTLDLDGALYDKVETMAEGRARLQLLRGRTHQLHGGVAIAKASEIVWRYVETSTLSMRDASDAAIDAYLARHGEALLGSVGVYQLENDGVQLFGRIDGDYFAILGMPLLPVLNALRERGALLA